MKASVIAIGDEILIGQVVDTNSAYIARKLTEIGAVISGKYTAGDESAEISATLDHALSVSDVVVITGGLGPTKDDITKHTLASYFGMELTENPDVLADVEIMLSSRGIPVNGLNRGQALVPEGCTILRNPNGTAPGMWFEREGKVVVSLPGVPFEMQGLIDSEVVPRLEKLFGSGNVLHKTIYTSGIAESVLAEKLTDWENSLPDGIKLAYLPSTAGVRLRLSSYEMPRGEAVKVIERKIDEAKAILGSYLLEENETEIAASLAKLLNDSKKTISVAESCTGGRIADMITLNPGASSHFLGGVVAYSPEIKKSVLGVPESTIREYGVVSKQTARAMAEGVRRLMGTDYAISTTGVAGPDKGGNDQPVGTVWIGIAYPGGSYARKMRFGKLRGPNIERASNTALNLLRLYLLGTPDTPVADGIF